MFWNNPQTNSQNPETAMTRKAVAMKRDCGCNNNPKRRLKVARSNYDDTLGFALNPQSPPIFNDNDDVIRIDSYPAYPNNSAQNVFVSNPSFANIVRAPAPWQTVGNPQQPAPGNNQSGKFNSITSLISQGLAAFGKRNTIQTGTTSAVFDPNAAIAIGAQVATSQQQQQAAQQQTQQTQVVDTTGGAAKDGIDGIFDFVQKHPLTVLGGAVGIFLLMKQPPGKR